ncbi:MAG TPA: beta-CASP ribonuclease aCPSF1, partial [Methanobacterium sp.]
MGSEIQEIKNIIVQRLPNRVQVAKVEFEGPEVVIYTKNPEIITENGDLIRDLAKDIRKRIIIRSDRSVLMEPEKAIRKIHEVVPDEAKITNISFDEVTCEVIIEARKPGLVIGKYGTTSREIVKKIGWAPKILRTPPIASEIIQRIRRTLRKNSKERKKILQDLGNRIHRPMAHENEWTRLTSLGGFREVGRSSLFLQTSNSKVLLDCGVNVAGTDDKSSYPYLNVPEFSLDDLDAVII